MFEPLHGLNTAIFTPMDAEGQVCLSRLREMIQWQMSRGVTGFFVCGSSGEGLNLSVEERRSIVETTVETVAGRAAVMAHVGAMTTREAIELARHAQEVGADAISSVAPIYYPVGFEGTLAHYKAIGAATQLPFFVYHVPYLTGASLTADNAVRLLEIPNLAGMKFTDPALHLMRWIFDLTGQKLTMLSGPDELHLPALTMGAHGAIGTTYNFLPGAFVRLRQAFFSGDMATAMDLQVRCNRVIYTCLQFGGLGAFKAATKLTGLDCGPPRMPVPSLPPERQAELFSRLEEVGFAELAAM